MQWCLTLCHPMDCNSAGFPVHHQLLVFALTHVHGVSDVIQPPHPLSSPPPPAFSPSQNQGLFQWVSSSHQVAKVLKLQLQLQSFQCLLISWLQSPSAAILEPQEIKSVTVSIVSPSICNEVKGPDAMSFVFDSWISNQLFNSLSFSSRRSSVSLCIMP